MNKRPSFCKNRVAAFNQYWLWLKWSRLKVIGCSQDGISDSLPQAWLLHQKYVIQQVYPDGTPPGLAGPEQKAIQIYISMQNLH